MQDRSGHSDTRVEGSFSLSWDFLLRRYGPIAGLIIATGGMIAFVVWTLPYLIRLLSS